MRAWSFKSDYMKKEISIPGYTFRDLLHEGDDTIVFSAISNQNNKAVIIKSLKEKGASSVKAAKLAKEFDTLENIGIEGVNKVSEIITYENTPALVMEDFGGIPIADYARSTKIDLAEFLVIATKITDILGRLHAKNIMHKNINPENIIINPSTGEIRIIDFGISAKLSREHAAVHNPNVLEGSLPYMSPEQTGRMNRSIDYRTDLYSLGITFYQMLTGHLPFATDDAMELIHCHIAKKITPVSEVRPEIPKVVSEIISKLTEKNAEERYQSAAGLKHDLEHCLKSLMETSAIPYFTIGLHDVFSKFKIPENLYGREEEVKCLLRSFEKVAAGNCELILVTGLPGIGKTSLVNEIHKSIVHKKGYFISGKFDPYKSNIPFIAFRHAFSDLLKYLISEPKEKLEQIKEELEHGLGLNLSILTGLIPEFELITGKQQAAYQLNPTESQNRFFFTLRDFIKIFATSSHPLIIFLDDLQWCDDASLRLIKELVTKEIPYLFLIGAYRSNEINDAHPLMLSMEEIEKTKPVQQISLQPLDKSNVNQLIADSMLCNPSQTKELTNFIYKRTAGNPFYIDEILKNIYSEGLINFNYSTGQWNWSLNEIANLNISDNVVQFMTERLRELPADCKDILELAACIGNQFKLRILKKLTGKTASEIASALWPAIEKELIIPLSEDYRLIAKDFDFNVSYKFFHDRIRQAAYSLIEEEKRKQLNLTIARVLLQNFTDEEKKDQLIELVGHYNEGRSLITDETEKIELAKMNLQAGKKAQSAVAYYSALQYFKIGIELLPANLWELHYLTAFELYKGYALNAYQTNDSKTAEECIDLLLSKAKTSLEKVEILSMRVRQYITVSKPEEAIHSGIEGLALLGYKISENPGALPVLKEILLARFYLGKRKIESLLNAPVLTDPHKKAAARLLTEISPSAFILGRDNLFGLVQLKIVNLSLRHGNCPESAYAYIAFGTVLKEAFGELKEAESFGKLGMDINEKLNDIEYRCRVIAAYGVLTHHFNHHWSTSPDWFKKGVEAGRLSGDLFFLAYCAANCAVWNPGLDLITSLSEQEKYLEVVKDTNYQDAIDLAIMSLQHTKNLLGLTNDLLSMNDGSFNEEACLEQMAKRKYRSGLGMFHIHKAEIYCSNEQYDEAYRSIKKADAYVKSLTSLINLTRLCIVAFFTSVRLLPNEKAANKNELRKRMKMEWKKMKKWAHYNPVNFKHWQYLMEAEMNAFQKKYEHAASYYEMAIKLAQENKWPADEAFANELASKFYYKNGMKASLGYWHEAHRLYAKWGAVSKVKFLEEKNHDLLSAANALRSQMMPTVAEKETETSGGLDVATIVKSSQAISGEIELKSLLDKMMHIIMLNAGAENGTLLLEHDDHLFVQASAVGSKIITMQNIPVDKIENLPLSIVNYVSNLKEAIVLDNASAEGEFVNDEYIVRHQPKSVLCSPVVFLNKLFGIVYLENNISIGAFTEERLKVLNLLSSQMAISIQNALLYANMEEKVEQRTIELRLEKKKSDDLLMNILPGEVANELKRKGFAEARQFDQTTVLFTDFANFTAISELLTPKELVSEIHLYFTAFDEIIERNGLEKIKTIGDAYLAVAGLPNEDPHHALHAAQTAMEMVDFVNKRKARGALFEIRAGLNSGPVVAGIVGAKKFAYDIWGDTVNTAARMETNSEAGKINISAATYNLLSGYYNCTYRGKINAKNKGKIDMYFIDGIKTSAVEKLIEQTKK